jgi:hypothetical protein
MIVSVTATGLVWRPTRINSLGLRTPRGSMGSITAAARLAASMRRWATGPIISDVMFCEKSSTDFRPGMSRRPRQGEISNVVSQLRLVSVGAEEALNP